MERLSRILIRICVVITISLVSFAPIANSQAADQLITPLSQIITTNINVLNMHIKTPIENAVVEQPVAAGIIYLPLVTNKFRRYIGTINDDGTPVAGHEVEMRFYDGATDTWSTIATQVTDASGAFTFTGVPSMVAGQLFYVRWRNTFSNDNYLWNWLCDTIDPDNLETASLSCDFNIHNFFHVSPASGASVRLPRVFEWTLRTTITDSYELQIEDMSDGDPAWWTIPALGYTGSYRLTSLPAGFQTNVEYGWYMWVYGTNGAGSTYYYRPITFQNTGNLVIGPEEPVDQNNHLWERIEEEMISSIKEEN